MTSLNTLGIRIMGITFLLVLLVFGAWKLIEMGVSEYKSSNIAALPSISPILVATPTLNPALQQELAGFANTAQQTLVGYTKKYVESLPNDIPKEQVLDQKRIETFVNANKGTLLADLPVGTLQTTTASGKQAIQAYLDAISPIQNSAIKTVTGDTIIAALAKQQSGEDATALTSVRASIESNFSLFKQVQTPKEAAALHTKLLQATQALLDNVQLLQGMKTDTVGGLIGQKNLADLNAVFADIGTQILALESKYNIK